MTMLVYRCEMDLAATYSMRRPKLARDCAIKAFFAALAMNRPDLAYRATDFIAAIGAN